MKWLIAAIMIASSVGVADAQYARPVEVVPARPVLPAPPLTIPNAGGVTPSPLQPAPSIANPPLAVVPGPPPPVAQGAKVRPRKCWCYLTNPTNRSRQRTTCETSCCKGSDQDERC